MRGPRQILRGFFTSRRGRGVFLALLLLFCFQVALLFRPPGRARWWPLRPDLNLYSYELRAYDAMLRVVKPVRDIDPRIRLVGIDDVSLEVLGQWPWPRALHGGLLQRLARGDARVAAFDVLFADPSRRGAADDAGLAAGIASMAKANGGHPSVVLADQLGPLVGAHATQLERQVAAAVALPLPQLLSAGAVAGFMDADTRYSGFDPTLHRVRLVRRLEGRPVPSLDLATVAALEGVPLGAIRYGDRVIQVGPINIPTSRNYEMNVAYYANDAGVDALSPIPYARALGAPLPDGFVGMRVPLADDQIKGGVFLIGATSNGLGDVANTPVGRVPGVYVHAQALNTILQQAWIRDTPFALYLGMMLLLPVLVLLVMTRTNGFVGLLVVLAVVGGLWEGSQLLFTHGWWLRPVGPTVTVALAAAAFAMYQFFRGHLLLTQFITPELAQDLLMAGGAQAATREEECTVIFSDIRGFTTLNESMTPSHMVRLLKEYHSLTVPIYEKYGGRCLDYLGDAQMVVYGDPSTRKRVSEKNHAVAAMQAGLIVHAAIEEMNVRWQQRGDPPFDVGIGMCSGVVAVGVLGADTAHLQYTVIGDVTNTAARVQGLSRDLNAPVICAESTALKAGDRVVAERIKAVPLKGKAKDVTVYRVLGLAGDEKTIAWMRERTREAQPAKS